MQEPGFPAGEALRIETLRELKLLDTPAEERFDRLTRITKRLFDVPIVLITLIDSDRQWIKSSIGTEVKQTPRSISFCAHSILEQGIFVVGDTLLDHRFADNPMVVNCPHIRFYAGRPILATNGQAMGTLCLIDQQARHLDPADQRMLDDLAQLVEKEINFPDLKTLNDRLLRSEQDLLSSLAELRNTERHERSRNKSLEMISRGYPLHEVLSTIAFEIEQFSADTTVCIEIGSGSEQTPVRYWGKRKPRNPQPGVWQCETAAIKSANREALGCLTIVRPHPGNWKVDDHGLVEESAILAAIAIERDQSDRLIWKQANYDSLTGLPNRNLLQERLGQELNKARRHRLMLGLMFIDLDHFKQINDSLGHHKGDLLLAQIGERLQHCMRDSDTVARLGGDEFTVIAVELNQFADAELIAGKVLQELSRKFILGPESVYLSASIGIAFYPDHGEDMDTLIDSADSAMYDAKNDGGNRFTICNG